MQEVLHEAISMHNLPASVLLGIMLLYWLMVLIGAMDTDMDTVDVGGHGDMHIDTDAHIEGHGHLHSEGVLGGLFIRAGRFLRLGQVPLMVVMSILALFMWPLSMLANYYFNGTADHRSTSVALAYLLPNFLVSALLTRLVTAPVAALFKNFTESATESEGAIGRQGRIVSMQVTHVYGQVEITTSGAPLLVNARLPQGAEPLEKGTPVVISEALPSGTYLIRAMRPDEIVDLSL